MKRMLPSILPALILLGGAQAPGPARAAGGQEGRDVRIAAIDRHEPGPSAEEPSEAPGPLEADELDLAPAWFRHDGPGEGSRGSSQGDRTIKGRQSATEGRAESDARLRLERATADWLSPEVDRSWKPPARLIDAMILDEYVEPVVHDYGTLYVAGYRADFSPERRAPFLETYNREVVTRRLVALGGGLAFVLACLAGVAGYIRADEATKGYYTNRLRLAAAAAVGAAGMAIYRVLV